MSKLGVAFFSLAFLTASVSSQTPSQRTGAGRCSLTESTSPTVRGLRLGLTTEQLLALFPRATKRTEIKAALDRAKSVTGDEPVWFVFDATDADAREFSGVESVSAAVLRGRVVDFSILYGGATWRSIDEWVTKLSTTFNLPGSSEWKVGLDESPNKILNCEQVLIQAAIQGGSASMTIRKADYLKEMQERAAALEEKKRREIKP